MFSSTLKIKITMCLIASITILGGAIIAPAMGSISAHFSDSDPTLVRLIMSMPGLFVIPSCLLTNYLCIKFGKKNILIFSLLLYATAGCLGAFMSDVYSILLTRAFVGIGVGLLSPIAQSLPADFFTGKEKEVIAARLNGSVSLGNCVFMPLSGMLAAIQWNYSFLAYAVIYIILMCSFFALPNKFGISKDESVSFDNNSQNMPVIVYFVAFAMFIVILCIYLLMTNLAIIIADRELGSPAISGYALAITSICSFFVSYNLIRIRNIFGNYIYTIIALSYSITFMMIYKATSIEEIFIAQIIQSFGSGMVFPCANIEIMRRVPKQILIKALSYISCTTSIGTFLSPIVFAYLPNLPNHEGIAGQFFTVSVFYVSLVIISFLFITFNKINKINKLP